EYTLKYDRTETKTTMDIMNEMGNQTAAKGVAKDNETLPIGIIISVISGVCIVIAAAIIIILKKRGNQTKKDTKNKKQKQTVDVGQADLDKKKKRLRSMLIEGSITEEEYQELLQKLAN
ncbi:MAG: hypothetical protein AB2401_02530, partial [Bacillus sp. (in: firmicutes)]